MKYYFQGLQIILLNFFFSFAFSQSICGKLINTNEKMILPISVYGSPILVQRAQEISKDYSNLHELIDNMFESMYNAGGIGLAAPQIGYGIRVFVVDAKPIVKRNIKEYQNISNELSVFKKVFINPNIISETGKDWKFEEGCLSIPKIKKNVSRKATIMIEYYDENFEKHVETYSDIRARIIQHEYDHIEGILYIDRLQESKKREVIEETKKRLDNIKTGAEEIDYLISIP